MRPIATESAGCRERHVNARAARGQSGFTLIEFLITLAIVGIIAAIAGPNMSEFIRNNARAARLNTMVASISLARSEAVSTNGTVTICESANGTACNSPVTGFFEDGWIIFEDGDADGVVDAGEDILKVIQPDMAGSATLTFEKPDGTKVGFLAIGGRGRPTGFTGNSTFRYCDARGSSSGAGVRVSITGQPNTKKPDANPGTLRCP